MRRVSTILLALAATSYFLPVAGQAQPFLAKTPWNSYGPGPLFNMDYSTFAGPDELTYVEFYIQVGYDGLEFVQVENRFRASYELTLSVLDLQGKVVAVRSGRDTFELPTREATRSPHRARISMMAFLLPPDVLELDAVLCDLQSGRTSRITSAFRVRRFSPDSLRVSDLQFSQNIYEDKPGNPYVKNGRFIEPMAVRNFDEELTPYLYVYFELYNLKTPCRTEAERTYTTEYIFTDEIRNTVAHLRRTSIKPGTLAAHSLRFPVKHLEPGRYQLTVRVRDNASGLTSETTRSFAVVDVTPTSDATQLIGTND